MRRFKILYAILSLAFLIYLIWPYSPSSIEDFKDLPNSVRSKLSGDTVEVPNLKAYFSDNYREFVLSFYSKNFQEKHKFPFKPLRLNYPPEYAFEYIKDQTHSTYLEELTYPMRGSLFINGLEPFDNETGEIRYAGATHFVQDNQSFETKVTMRYYPSPLWARVLIWLGINVSFIMLYKVLRRIALNE
jgi:hypothetical protein